MVTKGINLGDELKFESITAAKSHFDTILKNTEIDARVPPQAFGELKALYEEYCRKTNYPLDSQPIRFYPTYERGKGYTTRCFGVDFIDGSRKRFSLDKALTAVAMKI